MLYHYPSLRISCIFVNTTIIARFNGQHSACSIHESHRSLAAPREVLRTMPALGVRRWSLPHGCLKLEVLSSQLVYVSKSTMSNSIQRYNATAMQQTWMTPDAELPFHNLHHQNLIGHGIPR